MDNKKKGIGIFIAAIFVISVFAFVMPVVAKTPHSGSTEVDLENNVVNWTTLYTEEEDDYFEMGFEDYYYPVDAEDSIYWVAPSYVRYNVSASEYLIGEWGSYWGGNDREYDVTMHATSIEDTPQREIARAVIQENATNSPSGSTNINVSCELELLDDNRYFLATYKVCNIGSNTLTNVKFYVYNDLDVGSDTGNIAYYDPSTDTFYQVNPANNYVCGFRPVIHSTHHNLSYYWEGQMDAIADDVLVDNNKYPDTGTDDCGMVAEWDVGTLNPGDCVEYPVYFCVSDTSVADFMSCFAKPVAVPALTPIGLIALVGLLSVIVAMSIKIRKRRG
ncbi:MAG: hypothetical protein WA977_04095 [Halobacteriota archaeon]